VNVLERRRLGRTSLEVSPLCIGAAPLGSVPANFGYEVGARQAELTLTRVFDSQLNFLDTSNSYGAGESERRIGAFLAERGGLPEDFVLSTKVDRDPVSGDFNGERVRRSAAESQERLGVDGFQLLFLHDPEHIGFEEAMRPGGAVETLMALKDEGVARYIGVAGGPVSMLRRFVHTGAFDAVLTHNRFTLVDQSAAVLIDEAHEAGLGVLNAAPYGGGILGKGPKFTDRYAYRPAPKDVLDCITAMESLCEHVGVTLGAAALHYSLRNPHVTSTVVGTAKPEHVDALIDIASTPMPNDLWEQLDGLVPPPSTWLD
jgi:D-threo-aldose 1-dehydrogenase